MDQTKNNLERIRAFDAEEGEWRTINGAHVLIKNGRIASGAGGALNGQPFRGGSLKKMPAGSKGMEKGKAARHESHRGEVASRAQRALERYRKSREAERGGAAAPQQSAQHATKLGRMQPGSTAVNAGNEAKRLDHNARVYHRTARRAREAYNAKLDKAGGEPNAIEQKKNAYKAKSYENVSRRDQAAASAKGRIAKLRQLAKSLKARNPHAFKG